MPALYLPEHAAGGRKHTARACVRVVADSHAVSLPANVPQGAAAVALQPTYVTCVCKALPPSSLSGRAPTSGDPPLAGPGVPLPLHESSPSRLIRRVR